MRLSGSVVLVTGASRGIGRAVALELFDRGAEVVLSGRDTAALGDVAARTGGLAVPGDVRERGTGEHLVRAALDRHGRLDAVVVNAGVGHAGPFAAMSEAQIDAVLETNLLGAVRLVRAATGPLVEAAAERDAAGIVLVGSIAGLLGVPGEAVYSASKAGLETFGATLREELRPAGVHVTTVAPGVVDTELLAARGQRYTRRFPRPLRPERIARRIAAGLADGQDRVIEPRWLVAAERVGAIAPRTYRRLERRFG